MAIVTLEFGGAIAGSGIRTIHPEPQVLPAM